MPSCELNDLQVNELKKTLDLCIENNIQFTVNIPAPYGLQPIILDLQNVVDYLQDKDAAIAKYYHVSKENYLNWLVQNMSVQCCAETKRGKRCKNIVTDGNSVSVQQWVSMQGEVCEVHYLR